MKIERIRQDIPLPDPSREPNTAPSAIGADSDADTKSQYHGGRRKQKAPENGGAVHTGDTAPQPSRSDSFFVDLVV